jgi:hypothetical protein
MMMCPLPSVRFFNRLTFRQDVAVQKDLASHTTQGRYDPKIYVKHPWDLYANIHANRLRSSSFQPWPGLPSSICDILLL